MLGKSGALIRCTFLWTASVVLFCATAAPADINRAIIIGINDYGGSRLDYCVDDAKALGRELIRGGEFSADDVIVMTDDAPRQVNRPTVANISDRLQNLALLGAMDTLVVFFAGHGVVGKDGKAYLLTLEGTVRWAVKLEDVKRWMAECKAKNRILILDCCHAGKGVRDLAVLPAAQVAAAGILVLASCADDQGSFDDPERGHGVFTATLIEGLSGAADEDQDQRVTMGEAFRFCERGVKSWVFGHYNKIQTPVMVPEDGGKTVALGRAMRTASPPGTALPPPPSATRPTSTTTVFPVQAPPTTTATIPPVQAPPTTTTTIPPVQSRPTTTTTVPPVQSRPTTTTTVPPVQARPTTTTTVPSVQSPPTTTTTARPVTAPPTQGSTGKAAGPVKERESDKVRRATELMDRLEGVAK